MAKHIYAIVALGVALVGAGVAGKQLPAQDTLSKATFLIRDVRLFDGERVVEESVSSIGRACSCVMA